VPDHGEGREGIGASTVEHRAHPTQWLDDTSDRTAAQRRVTVKDRGHRQAGEHPGDQRRLVPELPQSRIVSGSRRPSAPATRPGTHVPAIVIGSHFDRRAERAHDRRGRADIGAIAGAGDPALAVASAERIRLGG
jgi:hypothetical protein